MTRCPGVVGRRRLDLVSRGTRVGITRRTLVAFNESLRETFRAAIDYRHVFPELIRRTAVHGRNPIRGWSETFSDIVRSAGVVRSRTRARESSDFARDPVDDGSRTSRGSCTFRAPSIVFLVFFASDRFLLSADMPRRNHDVPGRSVRHHEKNESPVVNNNATVQRATLESDK